MSSVRIDFKGLELDIEFDYQPEEPMVMYYPDGSGYPGCAAEVEITTIHYEERDISEIMDCLDQLEDIELQILEEYEG